MPEPAAELYRLNHAIGSAPLGSTATIAELLQHILVEITRQIKVNRRLIVVLVLVCGGVAWLLPNHATVVVPLVSTLIALQLWSLWKLGTAEAAIRATIAGGHNAASWMTDLEALCFVTKSDLVRDDMALAEQVAARFGADAVVPREFRPGRAMLYISVAVIIALSIYTAWVALGMARESMNQVQKTLQGLERDR